MTKATIDSLRESAKDLPENDPNRRLLLNTAQALEETAVAEEKKSGEKHSDVQMVEQIRFMGGAVTFNEADSWSEGLEVDMSIEGEKNTFDELHRNIWNGDRTIVEKARLTLQAAKDLATRIGNVETGTREVGLVEKFKTWVLGGSQFSKSIADEQPKAGEISFFKDTAGDWRWFAVHSNHYQDRDKEIFPEAAHKEFEQWCDATGNYPELRLWHTPGTKIGPGDMIAYDEKSGFMMSSGTVDKGMEDVAQRLASDDQLACSHGYVYADHDLNKEGVYARYRSFEITVLPAARASNPWTAITMGQIEEEVRQGMQEEKEKFLLDKLGPERTERIKSQLESLGKELTEGGVSFKDILPTEENGGVPKEKPAEGAETPTAAAPAPAATVSGEAATEEKPAEAPAAAPAAASVPAAAAPAAADGGKEVTADSLTGPLTTAISAAINESLAPLRADIASLQGSVKELQTSDDTKVADALTPRTSVPATKESRPTGQTENELTEEKAKEAIGANVGDGEPSVVAPYVAMALNGAKIPPIAE